MRKYHVYALIKDTKPVYIGCSGNITARISAHRKTKDFDKYVTIESFKIKNDALICERSIIKFITLFGNGDTYNGENVHYVALREIYIKDK